MRPRSSGDLLKSADVANFLISNLTNIRYLTGLEVSFGLLLATQRGFTLFLDSRYLEGAVEGHRRGIVISSIDELAKVMRRVRQCGVEAQEVSLARMRGWKREFKNTKFVQRIGTVEEFRRSKDRGELQLFHRAQSITREVIAKAKRALRPGIKEKALAWKLKNWAVELGADDLAFGPIVAFGPHTSRPHHHPTDRKLKNRDIVQLDVGASVSGYCADQSAVFFVGDPTREQWEVYEAVMEAKDAAVKAVKSGVTTHELDRIARDLLKHYGFEEYFTHALGHGVGLEIHEGPSLTQRRPPQTLIKNEIVAIEPGVYLPGRFGIRLEEEVVVS